MHNFKDLKVWEKSRSFVKSIYLLSSTLPKEEKFGIVSQIRRAVISISNNIVEGSGRGSNKDFTRFLNIAYASACEVQNLLYLSFDLNLINEEQLNKMIKDVEELQKMIFGLKKSLK